MIGPGWLPSRPINRLKKRTLAYVRKLPAGSDPEGIRPSGSSSATGTP